VAALPVLERGAFRQPVPRLRHLPGDPGGGKRRGGAGPLPGEGGERRPGERRHVSGGRAGEPAAAAGGAGGGGCGGPAGPGGAGAGGGGGGGVVGSGGCRMGRAGGRLRGPGGGGARTGRPGALSGGVAGAEVNWFTFRARRSSRTRNVNEWARRRARYSASIA